MDLNKNSDLSTSMSVAMIFDRELTHNEVIYLNLAFGSWKNYLFISLCTQIIFALRAGLWANDSELLVVTMPCSPSPNISDAVAALMSSCHIIGLADSLTLPKMCFTSCVCCVISMKLLVKFVDVQGSACWTWELSYMTPQTAFDSLWLLAISLQ